MPALIQQRMRTDCAICTITTALGRTYDDVMTAAIDARAFKAEEGTRSEYAIMEQFGLKQMIDFRVMHRGQLSPEYFLHFSWGRRAILAVPSLNIEDSFHSVYWSGTRIARSLHAQDVQRMDPIASRRDHPDRRNRPASEMKLLDLEPTWLIKDGKRVGFTFLSPTGKQGPVHWRQACLAVTMPSREQWALFETVHGENYNVQGCKPTVAWTIAGGIDNASFETMTVTPSLDGSAGGLWHGHITNGEIK
jgi:hypothetical protein